MRLKIVAALAATAALLPVLAQAEGLSYSYVDLAYVSTDIDELDDELDGFALGGSLEITDQVFLFADYSDQSTSVRGQDIDGEAFGLGVGYAWPIAPATDLYGKLGYVSSEIDFPGGSFDDDGYALGVGLRGRLVDQLELEGSINYVDLSDSGDDTSLGLAGRWFFTDQFAVGVEGAFGDDATTFGIGVRWDFGTY